MQSKIIKYAIDLRINAGHTTITIDDIINDLKPVHNFLPDLYVRVFKSHAKSRNYIFKNDCIVRSNKFKVT